MNGLRIRLALVGALLSLAACLLAAFVLAEGASIEGLAWRLSIAALVSVLAGAFAGLALGHLLVGQLDSVAEAARSLAAGDFGVRAQGDGEIGSLAAALNSMGRSVREQMDAAAQERNRLAAALNSSIDAVAALNSDGRVVFANTALERLFEKQTRDVVGNPFVWLLPDRDVVDAVRASRDLGRRGICLIQRPGRQYLQVATTPISGGGEWSVLMVFHDLTEVRRVEQTRRDFIANVSHELRTPLAGIKSVVETLADGAIQDPAIADEFLRRADAEVDRLVQLVEELLELSRIESGELPLQTRLTDIGLLLRDVVERLRPQAERKRQKLSLELPDEALLIEVDPARIERAIVNLVHNAIKFTPEEGKVTVAASAAGDELLVRVSDTGIGMAPEELPRVFERFYKTDSARSAGGSGLGLALVKHAVESQGGRVEVESSLGQGSVFSLRLPRRRLEEAAPA